MVGKARRKIFIIECRQLIEPACSHIFEILGIEEFGKPVLSFVCLQLGVGFVPEGERKGSRKSTGLNMHFLSSHCEATAQQTPGLASGSPQPQRGATRHPSPLESLPSSTAAHRLPPPG